MKLYSIVYYPSDPLIPNSSPSVNKTMALLIKQCPDTCTLHTNLMYRETDKHTDILLNILIAPNILLYSTKF